MSTSGGNSGAAITAESLIDAIVYGSAADLGTALAKCRSGGWPISPAACLFVAVKMMKEFAVAKLLAEDAPFDFTVGTLQPSDLEALRCSDISADGVLAFTPLAIAVRQMNRTIAELLLIRGGGKLRLEANGSPILLHLAAAVSAAEAGPSRSNSGPALSDPTSASSGSNALTVGSASHAMDVAVQQRESWLQVLSLLLQWRADPLTQQDTPPYHNFLSGERAGSTEHFQQDACHAESDQPQTARPPHSAECCCPSPNPCSCSLPRPSHAAPCRQPRARPVRQGRAPAHRRESAAAGGRCRPSPPSRLLTAASTRGRPHSLPTTMTIALGILRTSLPCLASSASMLFFNVPAHFSACTSSLPSANPIPIQPPFFRLFR